MSDPNLKELLNRLHDALDRTESVDDETLQLVRELDEDINRLIETGAEGEDYDNLVERAQSMETRFAVDHPIAERFLREIIDALAKVGI